MTGTCGFTEAHYCEILRALTAAGYRTVSFAEYVDRVPEQLILRHDIDISLADALRIARLDAAQGMRAVFHFLVTSEVYNMASREGQAVLRQVRSLGHAVGLHIDPIALDLDPASPQPSWEALVRLFRLAEEMLGPLDSFSLHRPATYGELDLLSDPALTAHLPASADAMRKRMIYRSDSRRQWRQGCICREIASLAGQPLQLLLHPLWWTTQPVTRDEVMLMQIEQRERVMDRYLAGNLSFYTPRYRD
jgi:hypothetical protein